MIESFLETNTAAAACRRGTVARMRDDGSVVVSVEGRMVNCQRLVTSSQPAPLGDGDEVLVWQPGESLEGVVLGRIGATHAPEGQPIPKALIFEAAESLTLRVGDGSITIRDGKILIKGTDLVSHAQRMNRIKGGAVSIN
jgi:hypothetical protein